MRPGYFFVLQICSVNLYLYNKKDMEEKQLVFNPDENMFSAEVQVNADYNLHIEMEEVGSFVLYQRGSNEGRYKKCYQQSSWGEVIDADFCHAVYPKNIKISVTNKPVRATIREAGQ